MRGVRSLSGLAGANASLKDAGGGGTPGRVAVGNGLIYYEKDTVDGGEDMCVVGNHLYILGSADLKRYDFSSNWNVTGTMTFHSSYTVPTGSRGVHVSSDETTFFLTRNTGTVNKYTMSTAGDLSTTTATGNSTTLVNIPRGIVFNSDLTKFFVSDSGNIDEYDLSTAGDLTTETLANSVTSEDDHYGLYLSEDGSRILAGGLADKIREYSLPTPGTLSGGLSLESTLDTRDQIGRGFSAVQEPNGRLLITSKTDYRLNVYSTWGVTSGDEVFVSSSPEPT